MLMKGILLGYHSRGLDNLCKISEWLLRVTKVDKEAERPTSSPLDIPARVVAH